MKAFQILDVKEFMKELLVKDAFNDFRAAEFSVTTNVSYSIDGEVHPEFYTQNEETLPPVNPEIYTDWASIKPFCLSVIKGKQPPLSFKIVFLLSKQAISQLLVDNHIAMHADDIFGLYLNCQYENQSLMCVTGSSLRLFSLDKTLDNAWDDAVTKFFKSHNFNYEIV